MRDEVMFREYFISDYISMKSDRVFNVRICLAQSLFKHYEKERYEVFALQEIREVINFLEHDRFRDIYGTVQQIDLQKVMFEIAAR